MKRAELAKMIDHTLLKPESTAKDVEALIEEGAQLGTFSVCVSPNQLPIEVPEGLKVAVVCGFPSGAHMPEVKAAEARQSVELGAQEIGEGALRRLPVERRNHHRDHHQRECGPERGQQQNAGGERSWAECPH